MVWYTSTDLIYLSVYKANKGVEFKFDIFDRPILQSNIGGTLYSHFMCFLIIVL